MTILIFGYNLPFSLALSPACDTSLAAGDDLDPQPEHWLVVSLRNTQRIQSKTAHSNATVTPSLRNHVTPAPLLL